MGKIEKSIVVNVPLPTVYNQLTQFTEFPRFMEGVQEIRQLDDTHLHWHTRSNGQDREWDAEITEQVPDKLIAWRNTSGPKNSGRVTVEPAGKDKTKITLSLELDPDFMPQDAQSLENEMSQRNEQDLIRLKQFLERRGEETGEWRGEVHQAQVVQPAGSQQQEQQDSKSAAQPAAVPQQPAQPSGTQPQAQQNLQAGTPQAGTESWLPKLMDVWEEPLEVMRRMSEEMDRLFERFLGRGMPGMPGMPGLAQSGSRNWTPPVEVARRSDKLIICADLPGIRREDVHVEIKNDKLTIEGDRHPQAQSTEQEYRRTERPYGHFYRTIPLPEGVDPNAAAASMHDGVLEITLPVTPPPGAQGRRLNIQSPSSR